MKKLTCVLLAMVCFLSGCASSNEGPELLEPAKVEADMEAAARGEIFNIVMYEAMIEPQVKGQSFGASGVIEKLNVTLGDVVKKGDVLGVIDVSNIQEQRDALALEIDTKTQNQSFDMQAMDIHRQLYALEGNSLQAELLAIEIEESEKLFEIELGELQAQLNKLDASLKNNAMTASCGGTVVKMTVAPGMDVKGGQQVVFIADDSTMEINTQYITSSDIEACDRVYASIGGEEYDVQYVPYDRDEYLRLAMTGAEMSSVFNIVEPGDDITNGMFTCLYLVTDYVADALKIPANAVHSDSGGSYVYLAQDGEQVKQYVQTGVVTEAEVQIISGLEEGAVFYVAS